MVINPSVNTCFAIALKPDIFELHKIKFYYEAILRSIAGYFTAACTGNQDLTIKSMIALKVNPGAVIQIVSKQRSAGYLKVYFKTTGAGTSLSAIQLYSKTGDGC